MKNKKKSDLKLWEILTAVFALIALIYVVIIHSNILSNSDLPLQLIGTIIGMILSAFITVLLLKGQTEVEEENDLGLRVFEKKQEVYFEFIETLEKITQDGRINVPGIEGYVAPKAENEINDELQHLIYQLGKLRMTASVTTANDVTGLLGKIIGTINNKSSIRIADKYSGFAGQIFQLVSILRSDMYNEPNEEQTASDSDKMKDVLQLAGFDIKPSEPDENVLANYLDLLVAEFKETYHTRATHINLNGKESTSFDAAKAFLKPNRAYIQIRTPLNGREIFDFELVNDSKYPTVQNQAGLRSDWSSWHNVKPINFIIKDAAFYEFRDADENGRKKIVKETLHAIEGLEEFLKK